jgi:NTP pyrophosphatase (non-canonical NTP hydrolase)
VSRIERERGFSDETALEKCLLLGEELGELFKAVRKRLGIKTDTQWKESTVEDELADILTFV